MSDQKLTRCIDCKWLSEKIYFGVTGDYYCMHPSCFKPYNKWDPVFGLVEHKKRVLTKETMNSTGHCKRYVAK